MKIKSKDIKFRKQIPSHLSESQIHEDKKKKKKYRKWYDSDDESINY